MLVRIISSSILLISLLTGFSYAHELTDEYNDLFEEVIIGAEVAYKECKSSVSKAKYWYRVSKCMEAGGGLNVGGGCGHIAQGKSKEYHFPGKGLEFCDMFKLGSHEIKKYIDIKAKHKGISKYKKEQ